MTHLYTSSFGIQYGIYTMGVQVNLKACLKCGKSKDLAEFNLDRSRPDGRHPYCTPCKTAPYLKPGRWERYRQEVRARKTKVCPRCGKRKATGSFYPSKGSVDGRSSHCAVCTRSLRKEYYDPKKARVLYKKRRKQLLRDSKQQREAIKLDLIQRLGGQCKDCEIKPGDEWPLACFDFHHKSPKSKKMTIGPRLLSSKFRERLLKELKNCVCLCSNCHRRRHARGVNSLNAQAR